MKHVDSHTRGLVLAACLALVPALACAKPPRVATTPKATPAAPLIETSRVFFPKRSGDWRVIHEVVLPYLAQGIQLRYASRKAEAVVADIFIYPAGLMPAKDALARGGKEFRESFDQAEQAGMYVVTSPVRTRGFTIAREPLPPLHGARFDFEYSGGGTPVASSGVLMYRYLHYLKLRVTAPRETPATVDRVTRELMLVLTRIRIVNRGGCAGDGEVHLVTGETVPEGEDPVSLDGWTARIKGDETQEQLEPLALEAAVRQIDAGCVRDFAGKPGRKRRGERMLTLEYPPDAWDAADPAATDAAASLPRR